MRSSYLRRLAVLWIGLLVINCGSLVSPFSESSGCPTPDEPYLYPSLCSSSIDAPRLSSVIFDPPFGKIPLRVRFQGDADAGLREFDENLTLHWDVDGDGEEDAASLPGEDFYVTYETCETVNFQVWADDELGRVSTPLQKIIRVRCNEKPIINNFSSEIQFGAPGDEFTYFLDAYDPDPTDPKLVKGIKSIEWDFDGDGKTDQITDGRATILPNKHTYESVGIYRASVEVFDDEGDSTRSNKLQFQVLGTSELLQNVATNGRADVVVTRGNYVVTMAGHGITIRQPNSQGAMQEVSQVLFGDVKNSAVAKTGNLFVSSDDVTGLYLWNASSNTAVTASVVAPRLLSRCDGNRDYSRLANGTNQNAALNDLFVRDVMVTSFETTASTPATVAVILRAHSEVLTVLDNEFYLLDLSNSHQIPVTEGSSSSCVDGKDIIPIPSIHNLRQPISGGAFSLPFPIAATSVDGYMYVVYSGSKQIESFYLPAFYDDNVVLPSTTSARPYPKVTGHSKFLGYLPSGVAARPSYMRTNKEAGYYPATNTDIVQFFEPFDANAPITLYVDGAALPTTAFAIVDHETVRLSGWVVAGYALELSDFTADYVSPALVHFVDIFPQRHNTFARRTTSGNNELVPIEVGVGTIGIDDQEVGKALFWDDWVLVLTEGIGGIANTQGLFIAPITNPSNFVVLPGTEFGVRDFTVDANGIWVAKGGSGVLHYSLDGLTNGMQIPAISASDNLSYSVGGLPSDFAFDVSRNELWVAEGKAGSEVFKLGSNDRINRIRRTEVVPTAVRYAIDQEQDRLYVGGNTEVVSVELQGEIRSDQISGLASTSCLDFRSEPGSGDAALAYCEIKNNSSKINVLKAQISTNVLAGNLSSFEGPSFLDGAVLGPLDAAKPRVFYNTDAAIGNGCYLNPGGDCGEPLKALPTDGPSPQAFLYRTDNVDYIVAGSRFGHISFWDFTDLPTEIGKITMCDPVELWLPQSVCQANSGANFDTALELNDVAVVPPYAFLATTWGVFAMDLRAAPILRIGSIFTSFPANSIEATYVGGGKYLTFVGTSSGISVVRFAAFEPAE